MQFRLLLMLLLMPGTMSEEQGAFEMVSAPTQNMFQEKIEMLSPGVQRVVVLTKDDDAAQITWHRAQKALLSEDGEGPDFRKLITQVLRSAPFDAYYWECPPVSAKRAQTTPFEFTIVNAPHLADASPDLDSFSTYLQEFKGKPVARAFKNLGGDSLLISPALATPDPSNYLHIGAFMRHAPDVQINSQWRELGSEINKKLFSGVAGGSDDTPIWVSTEGSGVSWLHMRIDPWPKYYHHRPYTSWPRKQSSDL